MIEGNRLTQQKVSMVIEEVEHFPGRERDEKEVLGYYAALEKSERIAASGARVSETHIQTLHGPVMADGRRKAEPTLYRDGQNVLHDGRTRGIVYMPPEAKDVPPLMNALVAWIATSQRDSLPCPSAPVSLIISSRQFILTMTRTAERRASSPRSYSTCAATT